MKFLVFLVVVWLFVVFLILRNFCKNVFKLVFIFFKYFMYLEVIEIYLSYGMKLLIIGVDEVLNNLNMSFLKW